QGLRQTSVDGLGIVFERQVVSHKEFADAGCITAASEVFEQQSVIKLPHLGVVEPDLLSDVHADPAATDAVTGRLAFHHIQRVAQSSQKLCEAYLGYVCYLVCPAH